MRRLLLELVNVGLEEMGPFMQDKTRLYREGARRLGLCAKPGGA